MKKVKERYVFRDPEELLFVRDFNLEVGVTWTDKVRDAYRVFSVSAALDVEDEIFEVDDSVVIEIVAIKYKTDDKETESV